ncbi:MAG: DUF2442 domain-containing protein [Methylococcales bacterium]|nr:DUF2442 domain-containing protein [Methylococcales bacterium]
MCKAKTAKPNIGLIQKLNLLNLSVFLDEKSKKHFALYRSMNVTSAMLGISTSPVEVTNISKYGFWLLLGDEELFLPFSEFPWFRDANVANILHVELPSSNHLYWPDLDIDLAVESIRHPEQFPLASHVNP